MNTVATLTVPAVDLPKHRIQPTAPLRRGPLPAVQLPDHELPAAEVFVSMAALDASGRLRESVVVAALGWTSGTGLKIKLRDGKLVIRMANPGQFAITGQGHLRLPLAVQRWCELEAGDRALLVGSRESETLIVYPPAALASAFHGDLVTEAGR